MLTAQVARRVSDNCEVIHAIIQANLLQNVDPIHLLRLARDLHDALQSEVALQISAGAITTQDVCAGRLTH